MTIATRLLALDCEPSKGVTAHLDSIDASLTKRIIAGIEHVLSTHAKLPPSQRIAKLPPPLATGHTLATDATWRLRLHVSSHVVGATTCNVMSQVCVWVLVVYSSGFGSCELLLLIPQHLRRNLPGMASLKSCTRGWQVRGVNQTSVHTAVTYNPLTTTNRLGASKWPLVGFYDAVGIGAIPGGDAADKASHSAYADGLHVQSAGLDCLAPADQHVHLVDTDDMWHFGSDMAQFTVKSGSAGGGGGVAGGWLVVADCSNAGSVAIEVTLLLLVEPHLEDVVMRLLRKCDDGVIAKELVALWPSTVLASASGGAGTELWRRMAALLGCSDDKCT